jgi:hypothetical protein
MRSSSLLTPGGALSAGIIGGYRGQSGALFHLVEGLESVSFDYYGSLANTATRSSTNNEPPRWHQRWDANAQNFPDLVRLRMEVGEGQQPWPELFLALLAERSQ